MSAVAIYHQLYHRNNASIARLTIAMWGRRETSGRAGMWRSEMRDFQRQVIPQVRRSGVLERQYLVQGVKGPTLSLVLAERIKAKKL
jgi:hypothetical protein